MKCPVCGNEFSRLNSHLMKTNDVEHRHFINKQQNLIIELFDNISFNSKCDLKEFNVYLNYKQCSNIWVSKFGIDKYKQRINKINSINVSKSRKGIKFSQQHKDNLSKSHIGQKAWNKGLTRKTNDIVDKYSKKRNQTMSTLLQQKYNSGEMVCWLKGKSKQNNPELIEMYNKVSNTMSKKDQYNSRGIACIREDIGHFAASTYEANIYRIFQYENKKYKKEYECVFPLKYSNGEIKNYRIDIQDVDGLFLKNAFLEIKGYMDNKSKEKIQLFREQYPQYTLLIIGDCDDRNISYRELEQKYSNKIPLWETSIKNAKKYPDLYNDTKWIIGKRENKRVHNKLLILDNGFKFKIGYLWKHQPFNQRPTYKNKFVKMFYAYDDNNNVIIENENWGAILSQVQQYIKDNARDYYDNYRKVIIKGYCKSENTEFDIVEFDILENKWY